MSLLIPFLCFATFSNSQQRSTSALVYVSILPIMQRKSTHECFSYLHTNYFISLRQLLMLKPGKDLKKTLSCDNQFACDIKVIAPNEKEIVFRNNKNPSESLWKIRKINNKAGSLISGRIRQDKYASMCQRTFLSRIAAFIMHKFFLFNFLPTFLNFFRLTVLLPYPYYLPQPPSFDAYPLQFCTILLHFHFTYLPNVDFAILIIIVSLHETRFQLLKHCVGDSLKMEKR